MELPRSRLLLLGLLLALLATVAVVPLAAASSYDVSVPGAIDVPDRTIEVEAEQQGLTFTFEFDITSTARVAPGGEVNVETVGPEGDSYYAELYSSDSDRLSSTELSGENSTTFSTMILDPGTYLVALRIDDTEIHDNAVPVVVAAYDADVTLPEEATPGETITATIELDAYESEYDDESEIDSVELLLRHGADPEPIRASSKDGEELVYEADITVPDDEGEYTILSSVFGHEDLTDSEKEMLEITEASITVSESGADDDPDGSSDDDATDDEIGDADDGSEDSDDSNDTSNEADEVDDTDGDTDVPDDVNDTDDSDTDGVDDVTDDGNDTDEAITNETNNTSAVDEDDTANGEDTTDSSDDDDGVITPNNASEDDTSSAEAPLTGFPQFIGALLLLSLIARYRRQQSE